MNARHSRREPTEPIETGMLRMLRECDRMLQEDGLLSDTSGGHSHTWSSNNSSLLKSPPPTLETRELPPTPNSMDMYSYHTTEGGVSSSQGGPLTVSRSAYQQQLPRGVRSVPNSPISDQPNTGFDYVLSSMADRNGSANGRLYGSYRNVFSTTAGDRMRLIEHQNNNLKSQVFMLQGQLNESRNLVKQHENRVTLNNEKVIKVETQLQMELANRSYLETHNSSMMAELTELRTRLKAVEQERNDFKLKFERLESIVAEVKTSLDAKDTELEDLRAKVNNNRKLSKEEEHSIQGEYEALKKAVNELIVQNEEKDVKIDELRKAVTTYQKVEEIILNSQSPRRKSEDADTVHSTSLHNGHRHHSVSSNGRNNHITSPVAPPVPKRGLSVQRSNSYDASRFNRIADSEADENDEVAPLPKPQYPQGENFQSDSKHKGSCTSLPRDYGNRIDMSLLSAPGKDDSDAVFTDDEDIIREQKKKRGLKRFFARMRRSTSQEVVGGDKPFKRGGVRSTAGPRLGGGPQANNNRNRPAKSDSFISPFKDWTSEQIGTWLFDMGLAMYINDCRKWCKGGQHMLDASHNEVEKELKIHNNLHKKKLRLAIEGMRSGNRKDEMLLNGLRSEWITKWLDDIGLPQYKDQFYDARIDGRVLNHLTVDDLLYMKINNALHHMSIRRGIEVLRSHNFNLGTLKRRPSLERTSDFMSSTLNGSAMKPDSKERDVSLWTNHRVMEWLRMIDLSEYAANLRGSGVHGALIMLEPRFTVEHLANILVIPVSKTLLRRHLSGHFVNLVGHAIQSQKRELEQKPGMTLTLNMKIKSRKTNPFKRGRPSSEYICPMDIITPIELSSKSEDQRVKTAVAMYKKELNKRDSKKDVKK